MGHIVYELVAIVILVTDQYKIFVTP